MKGEQTSGCTPHGQDIDSDDCTLYVAWESLHYPNQRMSIPQTKRAHLLLLKSFCSYQHRRKSHEIYRSLELPAGIALPTDFVKPNIDQFIIEKVTL
jgi:hypothetical protein